MARKKREIPNYGTVVLKGIEFYRTRIEDADGKRVALYAKTHRKSFSTRSRKPSGRLKMLHSAELPQLWRNIANDGLPCSLREFELRHLLITLRR